MRTAHGIGDWGIISAMTRLLKEKYPNLEKAQLQDALAKSEFCGNVIDSKPKNKAGEIDEENGLEPDLD